MKVWISFLSFVVTAICVRAQTQEPAAIVVRPPAYSTAVAGQTVRLTCVAYGYPVPTITWNTTSANLDLTNKVSEENVTVNGTTFLVSVLQLCDLTSANTAEYACTADNSVSGSAIASNSAKFFLSISQPVTEPPSIVVRPPEINPMDIDDTVEMVCVAYGNPVPTITWSRPGCSDLNDTSETTNIKIYSEMISYENATFRTSVMQICGVKAEDSTQYTCTAKNGVSGTGLASPSASFQVRVNGVTSPTPTADVGTSDPVVSQDLLVKIIMIAEGVVILILLMVIVVVVACWCKANKKRSLSLVKGVSEGEYSLPPTSPREKSKQAEIEGNYAAIDDITCMKSTPLSSNPAYAASLPPPPSMIEKNEAYDFKRPTNEVTYEAMDSN